ncbi:MAG: hypothetical protein AVDCRST_MAG64-2729, partial [uncultured Phycisphaerae bacterium]
GKDALPDGCDGRAVADRRADGPAREA